MTSTHPTQQRQAMLKKLERRIRCDGQFTLPAVPALLDDYTERCAQLFGALGRHLSPEERAELKTILGRQLQEAFSRSQRSSITLSYKANTGGGLDYQVTAQFATIEQTYEGWVATREPPYFGLEPDAKVMAMAKDLHATHPKIKILDIGAGTGRNTLPLARMGYPVDAIEMTPKFVDLLRTSAESERLNVRVIGKDVFQSRQDLSNDYRMILVSEVVSDFRTTDQVRQLFELAADHLAHDGLLVINAFIANDHYMEDTAAREFAQQVFSFYLTPEELNQAFRGLPLSLVSSETLLDYEQAQHDSQNWPPKPWFPDWATGRDVFAVPPGNSPIGLRWLVFRNDRNQASWRKR
jgi:2-polyprenyl-3-methyl-5-hydroxy-6-metoxy-1,4-benzoquinol methylase